MWSNLIDMLSKYGSLIYDILVEYWLYIGVGVVVVVFIGLKAMGG